MRTSSLLAVAFVAASSFASAEPERPKIYFPRQVKRQYLNATITSPDSSTSQQTKTPPVTSSYSSTITTRQRLGDLLSSLIDPLPDSSSETPPLKNTDVTTIVTSRTIIVSPPSQFPTETSVSSGPTEPTRGSASTGDLPVDVVQPTTSSSSAPSSSSNSRFSSSSSNSNNDVTPSSGSTADVNSTEAPFTSSVSGTSSGILLAPTGVVTPSSTSSATSTGLVDGIGSIISSVLSDTSSIIPTATVNVTEPAITQPPEITATTSGDIVTSITEPPVVTSATASDPPTTASVDTSASSGGNTTATEPLTTNVPPTLTATINPGPTSNTTITDSLSTTTTGPTTTPTATVDPGLISNTTATASPTETPTTTSKPTATVLPPTPSTNGTMTTNSTAIPIDTHPPSTPSTGDSTSTGTTGLPAPSEWLPTTILIQPSSTTPAPGLAPTTSSGLSTAVPKVITPIANNNPIPDDMTEIQIAFNYKLNYVFVAETPKAAAQIFKYLPDALGREGKVESQKIQVRRLKPLDTMDALGYWTTLAIATFPKGRVKNFRFDIRLPSSDFYTHPAPIVYNLTQMVNPAIDILLGSGLEPSSLPGGGGSSSKPAPGSNDPLNPDNSSNSKQTPGQQATFAGIAVGAVSLAAAYGAAMFVVARRYKRKRQTHNRSSSITDGSQMSSQMRQTGSPALMGGALLSRDFASSYGGVATGGRHSGGRDSHGSGRSGMGNSARTAYISAPVAQENSLGWN